MTFDFPGNQTVDTVDEKTIMIKTTGHERTHFAVVLACLAGGGNLKPVIMFKRKKLYLMVPHSHLVLLFRHSLKDRWMNEAHFSRCAMSGTKDLDQWLASDPCWYGTCLELTLLMVVKKQQPI